jgi:hypothetical protein
MKRLVAILLVAAAATIGTAAAAGSEKPGPGDKQCIAGKGGVHTRRKDRLRH